MDSIAKWFEAVRERGGLQNLSATDRAILDLALHGLSATRKPIATSSDGTTDSQVGSADDSLSHFGSASAAEPELVDDADLANIEPFRASEPLDIGDLLPKELELELGKGYS